MLASWAVSEAYLNPLSVNPTKWLNTLKQFVGFDHFVGLVLKSLRPCQSFMTNVFAKSSIIGILYSPEYALDNFD